MAGRPDLVMLEPRRFSQPLVTPRIAGLLPGAEPPAVLAAHLYRGAARRADTSGAVDLRLPVAAAGPVFLISSKARTRGQVHISRICGASASAVAWCGASWEASRSVSTPDRSTCCRPGRDLGRPGLAVPSWRVQLDASQPRDRYSSAYCVACLLPMDRPQAWAYWYAASPMRARSAARTASSCGARGT